jgi:hypothetical protein
MANHSRRMVIVQDKETGETTALQLNDAQLKVYLRKNPNMMLVRRG